MTAIPPVAILAGGLGTRLGERTAKHAKSMIEVAGEPFIAHQLRLLHRQGCREVVLCVGHRMHDIQDYVGDGAKFGIKVNYSYDGEKLLGTGGAVRKALPLLGPSFLLTYGDSYLDIDLRSIVDAFDQAGRLGLMTVFHNAGRWDTSNIEFEDGRIVDYSKQPTPTMRHIDYGLLALHAEAFDTVSDAAFDLAVLCRRLIAQGEMAGYEVTTRFYEIGSPNGLAETEAYILAYLNNGRTV
jgi:NDP-sugar pyrophosphorylase family protein